MDFTTLLNLAALSGLQEIEEFLDKVKSDHDWKIVSNLLAEPEFKFTAGLDAAFEAKLLAEEIAKKKN